jgi:hypothetical protein
MSSLLSLLIILVVGLLGFLLVQRVILAVVRRVLRDDVRRRTQGREVIRQTFAANSFGLESLGARQIRGNGALILTREELVFIMAFPRRETSIPLDTIASVSLPRSHLGKTALRPLLHVAFRGPSGDDALGLAVKDPEGWKQAIEQLINPD